MCESQNIDSKEALTQDMAIIGFKPESYDIVAHDEIRYPIRQPAF